MRIAPCVRVRRWLFIVLLALAASGTHAAEWYVSPDGVAAASGTRDAPWDIASALAGGHPVAPGDTIRLLPGTYRRRPNEQFEVKLVGTAEKPVQVRPAPGARATIDGGLLVQPPSAYVWVWDLEILVSEPNVEKPIGPGSHPEEFTRPWGGLNMQGGIGCKYIDLVIHHCRQGISFWQGARDCEVHGCILYDNGWPATDRGHGHAIYTQNNEGTKTISDCLMTGGFGYTMHAYGSARAFVNNYLAEGNICYNAGTFLIGGGSPSHGIRALKNVLYGLSMQIGYGAENEDCEIRDNLIVNGGLTVSKYRRVVNEGNRILARNAPRPVGAQILLRSNRYDLQRANLAVLNWEKKSAVEVDPGAFLKPGDAFRLMDPRDFWGRPLLAGTYEGGQLAVPMKGEFGAFVLLKGKE